MLLKLEFDTKDQVLQYIMIVQRIKLIAFKVNTIQLSLLSPSPKPGEQVLQDQDGTSKDPQNGVRSEFWLGTMGSQAVNAKDVLMISIKYIYFFSDSTAQKKKPFDLLIFWSSYKLQYLIQICDGVAFYQFSKISFVFIFVKLYDLY